MIERSEKGERKFDILFMVTFIIFFLELLYLNSPKVELTDWLVVGLLFVLLYFFQKKRRLDNSPSRGNQNFWANDARNSYD